MAKNSENLQIVYDDVEIALGALASKDAIAAVGKIDASRLNGFRIMKTEYWIDYYGKTTSEGPIMIGMSPNHSAGEVEETIEVDPQASSELVGNQTAKRPVFPLEMIGYTQVGTDDNGILKGSVNARWSVIEGKNLNWWAYNMGGAALTTGTIIRIFAKHFGVWLRD